MNFYFVNVCEMCVSFSIIILILNTYLPIFVELAPKIDMILWLNS